MVFRILLLFSALFGALCTTVLSDEVVNLPQDDGTWYLSVVGPEAERSEILQWFDADSRLASLKRQTHFCTPSYGSPIFNERYASNITDTPTVRLQDAEGVVLYEVAGQGVPQTAGALFDGLRAAIRGEQRYLPWRRGIEKQLKDRPEPKLEEDVEPPVPYEGPPEVDEPESGGASIFLVLVACVIAVLGGAVGGVVVAYKKEYSQAG